MGKITEILEFAQNCAKEQKLSYQGSLSPSDAHEILLLAPGARLVDVRTRAEQDWVGRIAGAVEIEWMTYPGMKPNTHFLTHLAQQVDKEALVLFICRSGSRSHAAAVAAAQAGYGACYNITEGFEGDPDAAKHRNVINGWRAAGLPWQQG